MSDDRLETFDLGDRDAPVSRDSPPWPCASIA